LWLLVVATTSRADPQLLEINVLDASITLSPGQTDYEAGYDAAEGASGIDVRVRTDNAAGLELKVKCDDASPEIALADLFFKTQTTPGSGGSSQSTYIAMEATDQTLWSSGVAEPGWKTVQADIKVEQLWTYPDGAGGGVTTYTNTLTFTVVAQ
jgi:hypothetical protein